MLIANKLGALGVLLGDLTREALADLSPTAAALLLTLHHHGAMTATAAAAIAGVSQPTAVRVADGLIARRLVERAARTGRNAPLHLTPAGEARALAVQRARLSAIDRLIAPLGDGDRRRLERLLDGILAGATTSRGFARTTCRLCDHATCDGPACPIGSRATAIGQAATQRKDGLPC